MLFLIALVVAPAAATAQARPDWCRAASLPAERAICADPILSALDVWLTDLFLLAQIRGVEQGSLAALDRRNACRSDRACIEREIRVWIATLDARLIDEGVRPERRAPSPEVAAALAGALDPFAATGPGFLVPHWCPDAATPDELAICDDPALAAFDLWLTDLYALARDAGLSEGSLDALRRRGACGANRPCILRVTVDWIATLRARLETIYPPSRTAPRPAVAAAITSALGDSL